MPSSVARKHGFSIAAWVLVGIGALVLTTVLQFKRDRQWVEHTREVLMTLADVGLLEQQVVTAARGVVLFNRDHEYRQYVAADQALRSKLETVKSLVSDNAKQHAEALRLQAAMHRRLEFPRKGMETFRKGGIASMRDRVSGMDDAAKAQAEVARVLDAMKGEELRLLAIRGRKADSASTRLALAALLGIPFSLGVLAWVHGQLKREIGERKAVEDRLEVANKKLEATAELLRQEVLRDPLTGLYNRRYLEEGLTREVARCARRGLRLAVLVMDLDNFRQVNHDYGHAGGDQVLVAVARALQAASRVEDIACRLGGEEFVLVMPEATIAVAADRAETIRAMVKASRIEVDGRVIPAVTMSIGASCMIEDGSTGEALLQVADARLYRAKDAGRDRSIAA